MDLCLQTLEKVERNMSAGYKQFDRFRQMQGMVRSLPMRLNNSGGVMSSPRNADVDVDFSMILASSVHDMKTP